MYDNRGSRRGNNQVNLETYILSRLSRFSESRNFSLRLYRCSTGHSNCEITHWLEKETKHSLYGCGNLSLVDTF